MARTRSYTNKVHRVLSPELRRRVETALVQRGPGQATVAEVYEKFGLAKYGIGLNGSFHRFARDTRTRGEWVGALQAAGIVEALAEAVREAVAAGMKDALAGVDGRGQIGSADSAEPIGAGASGNLPEAIERENAGA